jgi:hypothetical protein
MLQRMLAAVVTVLLVPSCAESPTVGETEVRQGRISRIDTVSLEGDHQLGPRRDYRRHRRRTASSALSTKTIYKTPAPATGGAPAIRSSTTARSASLIY